MAKSSGGGGGGGGADSWPGFLSELSKNFLILRDVFGYALPGAVFLSIGVLCRRFSLHDVQYYLLEPYQLPAWLALLLGLGACYAVGHVMAGVAYVLLNHWQNPRGKPAKPASEDLEQSGPTQVPTELIVIRGRHPELMTELERQSTMTQLRGSTGVAMALGSLVFYWLPRTPSAGKMLVVAGIFQFVVFYFSAISNIDDLKRRTIAAAKLTDQADKAAEMADPAAGTQGIIVVTETSEEL